MNKQRKGILLAGGTGTRLWPTTIAVSKHLLPVFDKPMVYYPLTTLMLANITEILVITTKHDEHLFKILLGDGAQWGLNISYAVQAEPKGVAQALSIATEFLNGHPCALILGDNIFFSAGFSELLPRLSERNAPAINLAAYVENPKNYGVCEFDTNDVPVNIVEKPSKFISNWAITGLYFYDETAPEIAKNISLSKRREFEITDINRHYLKQNKLVVEKLKRGVAWLDAGNHTSLLEASQFVSVLEQRQGLKLGCPEEVAFRKGYINSEELVKLIKKCKNANYEKYLNNILEK